MISADKVRWASRFWAEPLIAVGRSLPFPNHLFIGVDANLHRRSGSPIILKNNLIKPRQSRELALSAVSSKYVFRWCFWARQFPPRPRRSSTPAPATRSLHREAPEAPSYSDDPQRMRERAGHRGNKADVSDGTEDRKYSHRHIQFSILKTPRWACPEQLTATSLGPTRRCRTGRWGRSRLA